MNKKTHDPQTSSLMDFWNSQQERLSLLSGMPMTDDVVKLTADFGESEIQAFEKLMQAQKHLASLLEQTSASPAVPAAVPATKVIPNPVIDNLDMSDPRTVRRFEIHPCERDGGIRGESVIPTSGILLLLGKADAHTNAMAEFFTGKGLTVKRIETNLSEEEAQALIEKNAEEGPITGMVMAANVYDDQNPEMCIYDHTMTAVYLIKHYTIYIRALKPDRRSMILFTTFLDGKLGFTGENEHYAYGTFNGIAKTLSIEFGDQADVKLIDFEPDVVPGKMLVMNSVSMAVCRKSAEPPMAEAGSQTVCSPGQKWQKTAVPTMPTM